MSAGSSVLALDENDTRLMLIANVHIGTTSLNHQMKQYVHERQDASGQYIIRLDKTWEKILLAARAIAAVSCKKDVFAIGSRVSTQRAILKFASYTGSTAIAGRFTPGAFTNQKQSPDSIAVVWWLLTREVRRIRGEDVRTQPWNVMVDLFLYRDPKEEEKQQEIEEPQYDTALPAGDMDTNEHWLGDNAMNVPGMGELGAGLGPVPVAVGGGWSNLDVDTTDAWS